MAFARVAELDLKSNKNARMNCLCMPVRVWAIIISTCMLLASLLFFVSDLTMLRLWVPSSARSTHIVLSLHAFVFAVLVLLCVLGLIAVSTNSRRLAIWHQWSSIGHLPLSIIFGIVILAVAFHAKNSDFTPLCAAVGDDNAENPSCHENVMIIRGILASLTVFVWLLQICGTFVNKMYLNTLA
ncbi:hypothetical protein HGRIS_010974 [Hohenbuehelia grisea]|uniref:Cytochrome b561 domain-containing protein n=1 Tax=Hohenbuehelia grisea TaxID=104357 RepID=A0ABR3IYS3_9AGAR